MLSHVRKFLLLVVGACACSIVSSEEPTTTNPLQSQSRPWCIGRFVFDRPVASEISNQRYEFRGEKLETRYGVSFETYRVKVESLEKDLKGGLKSELQHLPRIRCRNVRKNFLPTTSA
jgi:hypothetical protein